MRLILNCAGAANLAAFLDMIASPGVENTRLNAATQDDGYDILVSGKPIGVVAADGRTLNAIAPGAVTSIGIYNRFANRYATHPGVMVQVNAALQSTAAGRYQFMLHWWPAYRAQLKLPDFGPESQDIYALQLIRERHAYDDIVAGDIQSAIPKCSPTWASLPGPTAYGQPQAGLDHLIAMYQGAGGVMA